MHKLYPTQLHDRRTLALFIYNAMNYTRDRIVRGERTEYQTLLLYSAHHLRKLIKQEVRDMSTRV